ncbi:uncharacterized protein LOC141614084 [Silene latifolia]|uniref:uncharacterized protein LOC141614084 n=1 Tax=Silene latifolia TaxID=37657 RepID=UPI003D779A8D
MEERLRSSHVQLADISEFKGCLDACSLVDHPATGCHFTWNNKQGDGLRWAKLDRVLASPMWLSTIHSTVAYLTTARVAESKLALHHCQDQLSRSPLDITILAQEKHLLQEYIMIKKVELQVLYQRAKVQGLQLNDLSTRYFYSRLADRRARNSIGLIQDEFGVQFSPFILISEGHCPPECWGPLVQQVRVQEILDALKSIDRHKSLGIDGYSSGFFLDAWDKVGSDFKAAVFEFFQT